MPFGNSIFNKANQVLGYKMNFFRFLVVIQTLQEGRILSKNPPSSLRSDLKALKLGPTTCFRHRLPSSLLFAYQNKNTRDECQDGHYNGERSQAKTEKSNNSRQKQVNGKQ